MFVLSLTRFEPKKYSGSQYLHLKVMLPKGRKPDNACGNPPGYPGSETQGYTASTG